MSDDTTYNGWANYPTWVINMWLSNDEGSYKEVNYLVRDADCIYDASNAIKAHVSMQQSVYLAPELEGFTADLYGWAVDQVEWREIAEHWADDLGIKRDDDGDYLVAGDDE